MDLVVADRGESSVITAIMDENDVRTALRHPLVGVGHALGWLGRFVVTGLIAAWLL